MTFVTVIVTFFAGMGAGLGTGFAGMSAAAVISPMLITFLGMDPYMAAVFANKATPKTLNRATGVILVILGVVVIAFSMIG